jgi:nucleoside-diphosphate-sugar epimerase
MNRVLVLGTGFLGGHIVEHFNSTGVETLGLSHADCDLTDPGRVRQIAFGDFDAVINTAGKAINNPNESDPNEILRVNVDSQLNVAAEVVKQRVGTRVVAIGSAAIYDTSEAPISELSPLKPKEKRTAYIASKIAMREALLPFCQDANLTIIHPFNQTGERQQKGFVVPDWAERIWSAEDPAQLDVSRLTGWLNLIDVKDSAEALLKLLKTPTASLASNEYVIGSAQPILTYEAIQLLAFFLHKRLPTPCDTYRDGPRVSVKGRFEKDVSWSHRDSSYKAIRSFAEWFLAQKQPQ